VSRTPEEFADRYIRRATEISADLERNGIPKGSSLHVLVVDREALRAGVKEFMGLKVLDGETLLAEVLELRRHVNIAPELRGKPV